MKLLQNRLAQAPLPFIDKDRINFTQFVPLFKTPPNICH